MVFKMPNHGGRRPGAGRKVGSGKYGEPTQTVRVPSSGVLAVRLYCQLLAATKCILTAARLLVAQLETNEKNK